MRCCEDLRARDEEDPDDSLQGLRGPSCRFDMFGGGAEEDNGDLGGGRARSGFGLRVGSEGTCETYDADAEHDDEEGAPLVEVEFSAEEEDAE